MGGLIDDCSQPDINARRGRRREETGPVWTNAAEELLHSKLLTHPSWALSRHKKTVPSTERKLWMNQNIPSRSE
jgi:hypothetical protein